MLDVSSLAPLKPEHWPLVTDINIPVSISANGPTETYDAQAVCFIGETIARRLHGSSEDLMNKVFPLLLEAAGHVSDGKKRFLVDLEGATFRAQLGRVARGHDLMLRLVPKIMPRLQDLQLPGALKALLLGRSLLKGGLILIVAPNGQGKTTTASATVVSRLEAYGGYAQTIEDPCELPMHGVWKGGVCIQRPVEALPTDETPGDAFFRAMIDSMRQFPAIPEGTQLFVGEIQDSRTAVETVKAAIHGHLVVATLHARSPEDAVRRMIQLCSNGRDNMDSETARDIVSAALRGVWYQTLTRSTSETGFMRGQLGGRLLWNDSTVAGLIKEGRYDKLAESVAKQTAVMSQLSSQQAITASQVEQAFAQQG